MKKVMVYALSTCPWCMKAKQFLKDNKVKFDFVDYDLASEEEQQRITSEMEKYGNDGNFPFIIIDGEAITGFNAEKMASLLGLKK